MLKGQMVTGIHLKISFYELCAAGLIILAVALRIVLVYLGWPGMDSDEGTMGLMALHIAYRGEYPIFFYGQPFMGSLEAYLGAIFFRLLGPSVSSLRLGTIVLFAFFLVTMYCLTNLLYSKKLALVSLTLLTLGSGEILFRELEAAGGYPETLLFGPLLILYATWLALSSRQELSAGKSRWRIIAYAGWGAIVGLALWSDPLVIPFVIMAGLLLLLFCRHELRFTILFSLLLGLVIGAFPVIFYNLIVPLRQGTGELWGAIFHFSSTNEAFSFGQRIVATILVSLPVATGANPLCPLNRGNAWPLSTQSGPYVIQCTVVHGTWGFGVIVLWLVAASLAFRHYWKLLWLSRVKSWTVEERRDAIREVARLMLLGSVGLTLFIFVLSRPSGQVPWPSTRYLVGFLAAVPALISPLWDVIRSHSVRYAVITTILRYGVVLLIGITFLVGTIDTFAALPSMRASSEQQFALVHDLLRVGATRIYSDYWTCDRIIFQSNEQITCSVVDEQLQPGYDRYLPYRAIVTASPHPAYVFPLNSPQASAFAHKVVASGRYYQNFIFDGYVVYQPVGTRNR